LREKRARFHAKNIGKNHNLYFGYRTATSFVLVFDKAFSLANSFLQEQDDEAFLEARQ
jgi:hypothetical protein